MLSLMTLKIDDIVHPSLFQVSQLLDDIIRLERPKIENGHFRHIQHLECGQFRTSSFSELHLTVLDYLRL